MHVFHSKSADLAIKEETEKKVHDIEKIIEKEALLLQQIESKTFDKHFIITYDPNKIFKPLSYDVLDLNEAIKDSSIVVKASAIIICEVILDRHLKAIIQARNYSIPLIWIHPHIVPNKWIYMFNAVLVGNYNMSQIWSKLCKIM